MLCHMHRVSPFYSRAEMQVVTLKCPVTKDSSTVVTPHEIQNHKVIK